MTKKRKIGITVGGIILLLLGYGVRYCWMSFPIISGYGAKVLGSAVFVSGRDEAQVRREELSFFPLNLGRFTVDYSDSSVRGTVLGVGAKTAVFRRGLGVTLVNEMSEEALRAQRMDLPSRPSGNMDTVAWPFGDRVTDTVPAGLDTALLGQAIDRAFTEKDAAHLIRTRAVVVLYKGQLVAERYAPGFSRNVPLLGWSMTKSITSALTGILVKDGKLDVEELAPVPEWRNPDDARHAIRLRDLLQQCSGLDFEEDYKQSSDATNMLFGRADMGAFAAGRPLKEKPGLFWYYSSGNTNIISRVIRQTVGDRDYYRFPYERLFYPLGMYSVVMEPDASGTFVGSSYMYATARDWARFGLLYLQDGVYRGRRLLPVGWVRSTVTPYLNTLLGIYGYQFWLNVGAKGDPADRLYPKAPVDLFSAEGYEGQSLFIIPSRQLVIVRLGLSHTVDFDADAFLGDVLKAIP